MRFLSSRVPGTSCPCRGPRGALGGTVTRPLLVEGLLGTCVSTPAVSAVGGDIACRAGGRPMAAVLAARCHHDSFGTEACLPQCLPC